MRNPVQQSRPADTDHKKVSATSPRRPRYWVYLLIAVVVIAAALFFGWLPRQETHPNCLSCRFAKRVDHQRAVRRVASSFRSRIPITCAYLLARPSRPGEQHPLHSHRQDE
jgi:hypothetical protein